MSVSISYQAPKSQRVDGQSASVTAERILDWLAKDARAAAAQTRSSHVMTDPTTSHPQREKS
jgi:hypothetical protein